MVSVDPTPYAIICPTHKQVFLTHNEYVRQMEIPSARWKCPICQTISNWDDEPYEEYLDRQRIEAQEIDWKKTS